MAVTRVKPSTAGISHFAMYLGVKIILLYVTTVSSFHQILVLGYDADNGLENVASIYTGMVGRFKIPAPLRSI